MYITSPIFLSISKALSILCFQSLGYITLEVSQSTLSFPWKWRGTRRKEAGKFSMFTLEKNLEPDISTTHWGTLQKSGKLQCNFLFQFLLKKKKKERKATSQTPMKAASAAPVAGLMPWAWSPSWAPSRLRTEGAAAQLLRPVAFPASCCSRASSPTNRNGLAQGVEGMESISKWWKLDMALWSKILDPFPQICTW